MAGVPEQVCEGIRARGESQLGMEQQNVGPAVLLPFDQDAVFVGPKPGARAEGHTAELHRHVHFAR